MQQTEKPSTKPWVLVVDDDFGGRNLNAFILSKANFESVSCASVQEALNAYEAEPEKFSLIITDLRMPGQDGEDLAKQIREKDPDLPIILITGTTFTVKNEALFTKIIKKPFNKKDFLDCVTSLVRTADSS